MSTQEQTTTTTEIPAGTWVVDPIHSSIGFAVKHNTVETFKGKIGKFDVQLADGRLEGTAKVASIQVEDEKWPATCRRRTSSTPSSSPSCASSPAASSGTATASRSPAT